MAKPLFIWIGAGRARRRGVGPSGRALDLAASAGLPVPPGAILLDEFYRFALTNDLVQAEGALALIPDSDLLYNTLIYSLRLPPLKAPALIRPLAAEPGGSDCPQVADPTLRLLVDPGDPQSISRALSRVWSSVGGSPTARRDVAISQQVRSAVTGSARLREAEREDTVHLGETDEVQALSHLGRWAQPDPALPPSLQRLQRLLRGLRRTLGPGDWALEWADDGKVCWLTAVAPY